MSKTKKLRGTLPFAVEHNGRVRDCAISAEALADLVGKPLGTLTMQDGHDIMDDFAGLLETAGQSVWRDGDVKGDVAVVTGSYLQKHRDRTKRK